MVKRLILVLLLLTAMFGGIFGWKYFSGQKMAAMMAKPPPPATIASAQVRLETWQPYLHAVGSVEAIQGIAVTTEVPGQVRKILAESGQHVEAGDVILELDNSVDKAELEGLVAQHTLAKLQFQRARKLLKDRTVSQSEYDQSRAQMDSAAATVTSKRAVIGKKVIRAPFSGQLGIVEVNLGEYLSPGATIVPLQALNPVFVDYTLPERYFATVKVKQRVKVQVQAYPERTFEGTISAINPGIDSGTRSLRLRATLDNPDHLLRHGMFAEVRTVLPAGEGILTLPRTTISYNPYGESVFLIQDKDGRQIVQRRPVKTGEVRAGRVEIVEGLQAGQQVVSAGQNKLRNGQAVSIDNSIKLEAAASGG